MARHALRLTIDEEHFITVLRDAGERLEEAEGEVVMDLSAVRRLDPQMLRSLGEFAEKAEDGAVKVTLYGVHVDVYKVLKLMRTAQRFSFVN